MIVAAALLVLLGLGLFVAGILTGVTALYWACVAACVTAAVLLIGVRRALRATPVAPSEPAAGDASVPAEQPLTATARRADMETRSAPQVSAAGAAGEAPQTDAADPEVEDVEVTDLLLLVDLRDEVLVVDEHPRYHLADCSWLKGRETIPLPVDEARTDGFTPCAVCSPDRSLADRARTRRHTAR